MSRHLEQPRPCTSCPRRLMNLLSKQYKHAEFYLSRHWTTHVDILETSEIARRLKYGRHIITFPMVFVL